MKPLNWLTLGPLASKLTSLVSTADGAHHDGDGVDDLKLTSG